MSTLDREFVQGKLEHLLKDLELLKPIAAMRIGDYHADVYRQKAAERLLQTVVEAATDINAHLLAAADKPSPQNYFESFIEVSSRLRVFDRRFAQSIAPSTGLRNRIVHEYDELDAAVVFNSIRNLLKLYPRYVRFVTAYLTAQDTKEN